MQGQGRARAAPGAGHAAEAGAAVHVLCHPAQGTLQTQGGAGQEQELPLPSLS